MMQKSKSSSVSSVSTSTKRSNRSGSPVLSEYDYLGRLVTRERPIVRKSNSFHENLIPRKSYPFTRSAHQEIDEEDVDDLSKPLGVIRINDRHIREIYRIPTPPPQIKRVYHRLRSPEPKIIERIFVQRPRPEIIENIIQVPPEKVRIINREKNLRHSKPIVRTKVVHLKLRHDDRQPSHYQNTVNYIPSINTPQVLHPPIMQPTYHTYGPPPQTPYSRH